jgi:hypothetical protein
VRTFRHGAVLSHRAFPLPVNWASVERTSKGTINAMELTSALIRAGARVIELDSFTLFRSQNIEYVGTQRPIVIHVVRVEPVAPPSWDRPECQTTPNKGNQGGDAGAAPAVVVEMVLKPAIRDAYFVSIRALEMAFSISGSAGWPCQTIFPA